MDFGDFVREVGQMLPDTKGLEVSVSAKRNEKQLSDYHDGRRNAYKSIAQECAFLATRVMTDG